MEELDPAASIDAEERIASGVDGVHGAPSGEDAVGVRLLWRTVGIGAGHELGDVGNRDAPSTDPQLNRAEPPGDGLGEQFPVSGFVGTADRHVDVAVFDGDVAWA